MFVRVKTAGPHRYLQVVENHREGRRTVQQVIGTLGRLDQLTADGTLDSLIKSLARFSTQVRIAEQHRQGSLEAGAIHQIGPDLVFGRLWRDLGVAPELKGLLSERQFEFPVERAAYLTVLHRLFEAGSDRRAERWRRDVAVPDSEDLQLHHLYRAMRWLGENKDAIEEGLFARRRDLFTQVTLAFFDTTTLYFEGLGGEGLGEFGHSKDNRSDRRQIVVGAVLTGEGRPVSCEIWPGNRTDITTLVPVIDRVRDRFGLQQICWVADRGMISNETIAAIEDRGLRYILGARLRSTREVREVVLGRAGRYHKVADNLEVKDVRVDGHRYIVCHNPDEAAMDAEARAAILQSLESSLKSGASGLVANKGYRRFLKVDKGAMRVDPAKVAADARYDGKFVLRTNTELPAEEVALQYKQLLLVEQFFRTAKTLLQTRPIFHQWDATIRGHVFSSFLALVLFDELRRRLATRDLHLEWSDIQRDLSALSEVEVSDGEQWYLLRSALQGVAGKVLQAAGVAIPPSVRPKGDVVPRAQPVLANP